MVNEATEEPVRLTAAINVALVATVNVPALIWEWDPRIVAAINVAIAGWIGVAAVWTRRRTVSVERFETAFAPPKPPAPAGKDEN